MIEYAQLLLEITSLKTQLLAGIINDPVDEAPSIRADRLKHCLKQAYEELANITLHMTKQLLRNE